MRFTQVQIKEIIEQVVCSDNGLNAIMKMSLEALMKSERSIHNNVHGDMSNGYRPRRIYGDKQMIELSVPRTRAGNFHPVILGLLKNQEEEARSIAFHLYKSGLTTQQVGEVFEQIYGKHYSSSHVSRMFDIAREEVSLWLNRPVECYYPIVMIDAVFIPTRRLDSVSKEAYYTILGVLPDRTREVIGIYNFPTEGAGQWELVFEHLRKRGLERVDLFVCDSLSGIEDSIWKYFREAEVQLCVIHLNRNITKQIKPKHKSEVAEDLRDVFRTDDRTDSISKAKTRFEVFINKWIKYYPSIQSYLTNKRIDLYFTYIGYDYRIRSMIYSTNWVERLNRDFKRTTRMRGALPNPEATLLLLGGVAINKKCYQRKVPKLIYDQSKFEWEQ